jgi:redox-sensing transcriptional repressor
MPKLDPTPDQGDTSEDSLQSRASAARVPRIREDEKPVPIPTLERLTTYLRCLIDMGATGIDTVSSAQIEEQTGISAAQFRKDLSHFYPRLGEFGRPGVGYNVSELESRIAQILQIHKQQPIILIGAGWLSRSQGA